MPSATQASTGLAERYASALFELAEAEGQLDQIATELAGLGDLVGSSPDLVRLIRSPVISRGDQSQTMDAILARGEARQLTRKFVGVLVDNRRLFALPQIIAAFQALIAARRGETTAEVVSAQPLSKAQVEAVADALKGAIGKKIALSARVDATLLGGLIVKVGSRMIDSSLSTKLKRLSLAMKGIG